MKKKKCLMYGLMLMVFLSAGCGSRGNVAVKTGANPYYDDLNKLTIGEYEFHLGDTLRQIGEHHDNLSLPEEIQLFDKDSQDATYVMGNGQRALEYMDIADISIVNDNEKQYPLLTVTVVNDTGEKKSSYDLPVSRYSKDGGAVEVPAMIMDLLRGHKEEEEWNYYNPDTLCFARLTSEEQNNGIYLMTALVTVYENGTFQNYLQYKLEGMLAIRTDEDIARRKEDLRTIGRLDQMTEKQKAELDEKEQFVTTSLTLKSVSMGMPQSDKSRDYGNKVMDFVNSGRNRDYFMTKGDVTYTILEPYGNLLDKQELVHTTDYNYTFQPIMDTLSAYGNNTAADTAWYTLGETEEESELLVLPVITNFTDRTLETMEGRVAKVRQYGGDYGRVTLPDCVEDAVMEYWLEGEEIISEYEYDEEKITVSYAGISESGKFLQFCVDVTPLDYSEITIRYKVMVSAASGNVTDAEFGLKEYD